MRLPKFPLQKVENAHILFWLLKDISWCIIWKPMGVLMIFPTLSIAIVITYAHRANITDLVHNSAVVLWIMANSAWMVTEFFSMEENFFGTGLPGKGFAVFFFATGILLITVYYIFCLFKPKASLHP